jgi:hypothetical protein
MSYWKTHYLGLWAVGKGLFVCALHVNMFLHGQAWEKALEKVLDRPYTQRSAYMSTGLNFRGGFIITTPGHVRVSPLGVLCIRYRQCLEIATTGVMKLSCTRLYQGQEAS